MSSRLSRRSLLVLGGGAVAYAASPRGVAAQERQAHGLSAFGDLKYPADFKHFAYVNPAAPKGGRFSHLPSSYAFNQNLHTFNSLNSFVRTGDSATGMESTFATLMIRALDEPDAMYGLTASGVQISDDGQVYRFTIRPEAKFHDGTKIAAEDAAWSLTVLKEKGHPVIRQLLRDLVEAKAEDAATLLVRFDPKRGREIPLFVAGLPIFSKAFYASRDFEASNLEVPLGCGAYRVGRFEPGRYIEYDRVKDWWGTDLPVSRGLYNFDVVRHEFYRDRDVAFEAFTAGQYLFREEFTSRIWATRYNFPAINDGRVKKDILRDDTPSGAQGWFMNTRREKFKDARVREAMILAFDFEWTNKNIMYDSYERTHSFFQNSDMMAKGKPSPEEVALLEPFRGKLPEEIFGEPFLPPVTDGSGQDRKLLRQATQLLESAGYSIKDGRRANGDGEGLDVEFLLQEVSFQPHHMPYIRNLERIGVRANVRLVDASQYQARLNDFDFDIAIQRFSFSSTPGESMRSYLGSDAAAIKGSRNLSGVADPVVDALIERVIEAKTREELTFACRALDRVLRAGRYWIPQWSKGSHWIAYWGQFGHPPEKPRYGRGIPDSWWAVDDKAKRT
jgi:microcin C transport system substrate-binding protein